MLKPLKRIILGFEPGQEHVAVGINAPQQEIEVWLAGLGAPRNVTENCVLASLRPLCVALAFEKTSMPELERAQLQLEFRERGGTNKTLGKFALRAPQTIPLDEMRVIWFRTAHAQNDCLSPLRLRANDLYRRWEQNRRPAHNFKMDFDDLRRHFIFYICPRPVVLVTAQDKTRSNLFPMDLIGPLAGDYFALALRTTSPSVRTIAETQKIVTSDVPFEMREAVYALGRQHRVEKIDWATLPFARSRSPALDFSVPQPALRIREFQVVHAQEIGSHTLFLTRPLTHTHLADGLQLFHVHEFYLQYRRRAQATQAQADLFSKRR